MSRAWLACSLGETRALSYAYFYLVLRGTQHTLHGGTVATCIDCITSGTVSYINPAPFATEPAPPVTLLPTQPAPVTNSALAHTATKNCMRIIIIMLPVKP
jgi:hypothetical protein